MVPEIVPTIRKLRKLLSNPDVEFIRSGKGWLAPGFKMIDAVQFATGDKEYIVFMSHFKFMLLMYFQSVDKKSDYKLL